MKCGVHRLVLLLVVLLAAAWPAENLDGSPTTRAGSVTPIGGMSSARSGHTATRLPDGKVLIAGGMVRNGEFLADSELYDPTTRRFISAANMSSRRVSHTATLLPSSKVLITGGLEGRDRSDGGWRGRALATAELFDPATGSFIPTGSMATARSAHAAVLLANGKVLVFGGSADGDGRELLASAELYDPATGTFSPTGAMNTARIPAAAARLKNGQVLVAGGTGANRTVLASAELYNPATGQFAPAGHLITARHKHAAVLLADGRVLITGGSDARDWDGQTSAAELYDPAHGTFLATGKMSLPRFKHGRAVVLLRDGRVLIAGGGARAEVFNTITGAFSAAAGSLDASWHFSTATLLANGQVLIVGGYPNSPEATARAWLYQP